MTNYTMRPLLLLSTKMQYRLLSSPSLSLLLPLPPFLSPSPSPLVSTLQLRRSPLAPKSTLDHDEPLKLFPHLLHLSQAKRSVAVDGEVRGRDKTSRHLHG
jgi:hypothetical protein